MIQILTILWDSYRMLKARVMFWVVLGISLLVALVFASIGVNETGYTILFGAIDVESEMVNTTSGYAELFYLVVFTNIIVKWWLGWLALALAFISCCSIFPEFLKQGAVDVAVSKPMSRAKLFLVKYTGGLLFVTLQVGIFCIVIYLALGLRLGLWNASVFWAVPLLVFVFSMIYCVGVLVAVWTRSAMLSLLAMIILWGCAWVVQFGEDVIYSISYGAEESGVKVDFESGEVADSEPGDHDGMKNIYDGVKVVSWVLPKTRDVTLMVGQKIKTDSSNQSLEGMSLLAFVDEDYMEGFESAENKKAANRHSLSYTVGSSLLFECFILGIACWRFSRKDY